MSGHSSHYAPQKTHSRQNQGTIPLLSKCTCRADAQEEKSLRHVPVRSLMEKSGFPHLLFCKTYSPTFFMLENSVRKH